MSSGRAGLRHQGDDIREQPQARKRGRPTIYREKLAFMGIKLPPAVIRKLKQTAAGRGISLSALVRELLRGKPTG